jgi:monoterpene epsilon-lactone hydrolase
MLARLRALLRRRAGASLLWALIVGSVFVTTGAEEAKPPRVDEDGTVRGDIAPVPLSNFLSEEIKVDLAQSLRTTRPSIGDGIEAVRQASAEKSKQLLGKWLEIHPASIEETMIGDVRTHVVIPDAGIAPKNKQRVLINAHMGGFMLGGAYGGQLEAVPLAGYGRVKVIAVDYRMAPEHIFPAASEDMETVYRHVLKTTAPENVAIFGCSAGGTLTAQMIPWLLEQGLPLPGAIGIFCSGAMQTFWYGGDSGATSPFLNGRPSTTGGDPQRLPRNYFHEINADDPLVAPGHFPDILAQFPATLVVTGTRDIAMSNALITHTRLRSAGVLADLFVQEGLGHGHFFLFPGTPEAETAYGIIWNFFDRQLAQ